MQSFKTFIQESPDNSAILPDIFQTHYSSIEKAFALVKDSVSRVDNFHGMELHICEVDSVTTKYFGFIENRIVFHAILKSNFDYNEFFEFVVEMTNISKDSSVSPGVGSAFFWKYRHRDGITSISDGFLTKSGEALWFKIIEEALSKKLFVGAISKTLRKIQEFKTLDESKKFSGKDLHDWRFFVSDSSVLRENYNNCSGLRN